MNKPTVMVNTTQEPKLDFVALGLYHDAKRGEWMVARIAYDPVTKQTKFLDSIGSGGPSKDFGQEKFKIETIEEGFF